MIQMVLPRTAPVPAPRGRIGAGFSPVPHRYHLYLSTGCPRSLRVRTALALLGPAVPVAATLLGPPATHAALRRAYEAAGHPYDPAQGGPALCDTWSGRVVSDHTPDILEDLAVRLAGRPELCPPVPARRAEAARALLDGAAPWAERAAALALLERWLAVHPYALGDRPTLADVDLWVALADPAVLSGAGPRVRAYVRRLRAHPAFGTAA
ncbi:glutathione S-transferase family protein [Streptomyces sp. NBC_00249]|uniref:glutathione S-transferase family protein n=1 Tax=Streptomyces sp. NBC_00249 TaxID=2975690 RepID=UPI002255AB34|nr:glutathione S-transferase family protein [Streptomyces sp. NBC_00249]MCX5197942.1 glutathione S-transferase family protein [Streptomyces sp. NBC_00249]